MESSQNETHTVLVFSRPYLTCDRQNDIEITSDTLRLIYAFGDDDPNDENSIQIHKHHNRGTKSALLLQKQNLLSNKEIEDEYIQYIDFSNNVIMYYIYSYI